jgi:hypothetical protein
MFKVLVLFTKSIRHRQRTAEILLVQVSIADFLEPFRHLQDERPLTYIITRSEMKCDTTAAEFVYQQLVDFRCTVTYGIDNHTPVK